MKALNNMFLKAGFIALIGATGCAGTYSYANDGYYAEAPPPRAYVETRGPAPYYGAVWVDGYWQYSGGHYVWQRGHYVRPRSGYVYVPNRWVREGRGWRMHSGGWRRHYR